MSPRKHALRAGAPGAWRRPCAALLLLAAGACASLGFGPRAQLDDARAAMARGDAEAGYALLGRLEQEHPGSPESREGFPLAAECFHVLYARQRIQDPASPWMTEEPEFMFRWLAGFFRSGEPPQQAVDVLFGGVSVDLFRQFERYAKTEPSLARWKLRAEDDNGIVSAVQVIPAPTASR